MGKGYYQGIYPVQNKAKYKGDHSKVIFRSMWERQVFRWCDLNPDVVGWKSEETVIPYICKTDGKAHRYFVDLCIEFKSGKKFYVEIKPKKDTLPPKKTPGKRKETFVNEALTWAKNISKFTAAEEYAKARGATFQVWTEETLAALGIKIMREGKFA